MDNKESMLGKIGTGIGANSSSTSGVLNFAKGYEYQSQDVSAYEEPLTPAEEKRREVNRNLGVYVKTEKTTPEEKEAYYDSLNEEDQELFENRYNEGYGFSSIKALMENKDRMKDPYAEGLDKYKLKSNTAADIAQGYWDSMTGLGKFASKYAAKGIGGVAKALGADEEKVDYYVNDFVDYMENEASDLGANADKESTAYNVTNVGTDLAQLLIPGVGEGKGVYLMSKLSKVPYISKMLQTAEGATEFAAKHPKLTKILTNAGKDSYEGARDMILLNAINGEGTDITEIGEGGIVNAVANPAFRGIGSIGSKIPGVKTILGKGAEKLEVMGNMNSTEMRKAMKKLAERGEFNGQKYTAADVGKWMLERNIKGNKDDMFNQLIAHSDEARGLLDEILSQSTSIHNVPKATEALQSIAKDMEGVVGMGDDLNEILSMIKQGDNYTLTELESIKRAIDKYESIYTNAGDVKSGFKSKGMDKIRKNIKGTIEDVAKKEGLGDVRALNNEIAMGKILAYGVGNKSASEILNQWTSGALGSLGTAIVGGDLAQITVMGTLASILGSTTFRTNLANGIKKLGGIENKTLKELTNFVDSEGKTELSKEGMSILKKLMSESKEIREDLRRAGQTELIQWLDSDEEDWESEEE